MSKRYRTKFLLSLAALVAVVLLHATPVLAVPSWGGAVGSTLTDAANGYLQALNNAEAERLARRKAELELERLRAETERLRAQTKRSPQ